MRHIIFKEATTYPVALLIKTAGFNQRDLQMNYLDTLNQRGIANDQVIGFTLKYNEAGKAPVKMMKEYLSHLLPALDGLGVRYLYVADSNYFKVLTGERKAEPHMGYSLPCKIEGYEHMQVILGLNYQALIYDPTLQDRLDLSLKTLADCLQGNYQQLGYGIIKHAEYPDNLDTIAASLDRLMLFPTLACDIETFSLRVDEAGVGTIAFAWDRHHGLAFHCDYQPYPEQRNGLWGEYVPNQGIRNLLRNFFERYPGRLRWHNASFDIRTLIYVLWMKDGLDTEGLLQGLEVMTRLFDDTRIITYLATNSTAGNDLGLKSQAHEFAGNWAQDEINDIRRIPLAELLQYNLVDALCANYVYDKHWPTVIADEQEDLYHSLMLPSLKTIIQMELSGLPMDLQRVKAVREELETISRQHVATFMQHPLVAQLEDILTQEAWEKDYQDRKAKAKNPDKIFPKDRKTFPKVSFNPGSNQQLARLVHELMDLPVLEWTPTRQPSVGAEVLEKLQNHCTDESHMAVLEAIVGWMGVEKILSTFIPAFENATVKSDGWAYLHGNFNLGGTVSGRMSSNKPNLQNLPANSEYGKTVKTCFSAPKGWLFCGADFASLEDRINALLTKDPNKLKVYTDGYDGHCLRAYAYFGDEMPDIENTVNGINSIQHRYPDLRQESKTPTFLLTYGGTHFGLMKSLGWSEEKAKRIEANYHELYAVSTAWVKERIDQAAKDGYATSAFGLRIRTPLLHQTLLGLSNTPREAEGEARTLGNAISGQSYGLLTNRACNAFMERVWASPYRLDIKPVAMIHDAIYLLVRDDPDVVAWTNKNLIECMEWQELPEIQHPEVKLGAELGIFWPNWSSECTLPNGADADAIVDRCREHYANLKEKKKT